MCAKRKRMDTIYESIARSANRQSHDLDWKEINVLIQGLGDSLHSGVGNEVPDDEILEDEITY